MNPAYIDEGATYNRVKNLKEAFAFQTFPTYTEMSENLLEALGAEALPFLDRPGIEEGELSEDQLFWRKNGYLVLRNIIPSSLVDAYLDLRRRARLGAGGWKDNYPYESFPEIRDICLYRPLMERIQSMLGYRLAMYINLSRFKSTERGWHMDDYMCLPNVAASGVGIWFSLGEINEENGPLEFVPGSHRWPTLRLEKVRRFLTEEAYHNHQGKYEFWAQLAELYVNPACTQYISEQGISPQQFLAQKGDVLIWHGALMHRGSTPKNKKTLRPAIISLYRDPERNAIQLGDDGAIVQHGDGGWYATHSNRPRYQVCHGEVRLQRNDKGGGGNLPAKISQRLSRWISSPF